MPSASKKELEENVVKLQLRVANLERYTNELVAAVDAMLATHTPDPPPAPGAAPNDVHDDDDDAEEEAEKAASAMQVRFDDLQDILVQRLQNYVATKLEAVRTECQQVVDARLAASLSEASPLPTKPSPPASSSSSSSSSAPAALEHDLLACVQQIEALMDGQQQQHDDMETCMALLVRLEERQKSLEQARDTAPVVATTTTPVREVDAPCTGCRRLQTRVAELEGIVQGLCSERAARAKAEASASILNAAAATTAPTAPTSAAVAALRTVPPAGNERAVWHYLSALSAEVAAQGALLAQRSPSREVSPISAFWARPPPSSSSRPLLSPSTTQSTMAGPASSRHATPAAGPAHEIRMEETPQALRALEARARRMQSSLEALA